MAAHGRAGRIGRCQEALAVALALIATARAGPNAPGLLPLPTGRPICEVMSCEAMRADARLADVCFVDPEHGWAVGDRGTIWHTEDGGKHWHLQESNVACRLDSVDFIDRQTGWAAGGSSHPYTHTSSGVLLRTSDGGRHWSEGPKLLLPALKRVRFFNPRRGWAIGGSSAMFPSGVFLSDDGGRSWDPLHGERTGGWRGGDLLDPGTGALAGRSGTAAIVRQRRIEPAQSSRFGLRGIAGIELVPEIEPRIYGWLIGQGGLVMMTADLGTTWQTPPGDLPEGVATEFDFAALEVRGPKAWIAGSPGTRILHSPDAGHTWLAVPTGQNLPIEALCFADDEHGWAVGQMGTILATTDGGKSWKRQHAGGTRAAVLGLFGDPEAVPLELFARLSGNEGYLGVVEILGRRDPEAPLRCEAHPDDRIHEALVGVGACCGRTAWQFPLPQAGLRLPAERIVEGWDRANDGRGLTQLEAHLVRQIRLWRPDVVVTHDAGDPLATLLNRAVLRSVSLAEDPTSFVEQITGGGLEPWKVKRVYAALQPGVDGSTNLRTAELAGRLGRSLAEVAFEPRGLVDDDFRPPPDRIGFRLLVDHLPGQRRRRDFFTGIVLQPGSDARRQLIEPPAETLGYLRRIAQRRRNTQAILRQTEQDPQGGVAMLAQAGDLTRDLDPDGAAQTLYHLAQHYYRSGHWPLAADAFELLTKRHPDHSLSRPALIWLVQYYASGEAAWRVHGPQRITVQQTSALALDFTQTEDRPGRAAAIGSRIEQTRPALFAAPAIGFPLAVADRRRGRARQAERFYLSSRRSATRDAWRACAEGERWLAEPRGVPPKPVLNCAVAATKPRLDGLLDDAVWEHAKPAELRSVAPDEADRQAAVMLAYDGEFLYLAIRCDRAPGVQYETTDGPRPRDPDFSDHDRVDLFLDLDRDFATYYRLTIDHRGWPGEACWGDRTWNPTWFVATGADEGAWTAEAAIGLDQLTGRYPSSGTVWAIGIQRIVPGGGFQSWNTPASTKVMPEGFGYLIFQ